MLITIVILTCVIVVLLIVCAYLWEANRIFIRGEEEKIKQQKEMEFGRMQSDIRYFFTLEKDIDCLKEKIESIRMADLRGHNQLLDEIQSVVNFTKDNFVEKKKKTSK